LPWSGGALAGSIATVFSPPGEPFDPAGHLSAPSVRFVAVVTQVEILRQAEPLKGDPRQ
jgi:hypothetical protein